MGNGRFVPYNGNNKQFTTHSATAGSVNISDVLTTDVISTAVSESTTLPINSLNTSINTDYLRIYNNSIVPGAFLMQVTPYVVSVSGSAGNYTSDLRSQNIAISSLSFNFGNDTSNLVFGTYQNGSLFMISNGAVMPGEYLNTLPDSITFTLADDINGTASSLYAIYLNIYIHLIDVDTLEYTMTEIEGGNDTVLNAGFAGYYDIWSTDTALKTNLKSKYYTWLDALEANLAGTGLGMPAYTKLQESLDTQTVNTYSL